MSTYLINCSKVALPLPQWKLRCKAWNMSGRVGCCCCCCCCCPVELGAAAVTPDSHSDSSGSKLPPKLLSLLRNWSSGEEGKSGSVDKSRSGITSNLGFYFYSLNVFFF